jgi:hypothetical protein
MNIDEARQVKREPVLVDNSYEFYSSMQQEYEPAEKRMRNYTGQHVTVIRKLTDAEFDPEGGKGFEVRASDGFTFTALEDELDGWIKDTGQYFNPDATYGPYRDPTFLSNEKD